jgi:hypothetical protein
MYYPMGTNQVWHLSNLVPYDSSSLQFMDLTSLPFAGLYPEGDLVFTKNNSYYVISRTLKHLAIIGAVLPIDSASFISIINTPPELIYIYPYTMGSFVESQPQNFTKFLYNDTISGYFVDSLALDIRAAIKHEVVAWGSLKLPYANFQVLKTLSNKTETITMLAHILGSWIKVDSSSSIYNSIEFQMNNLLYPLVTVELDTNNQPTSLSWVKVNPYLLTNNLDDRSFSFFTNPAQNFVRFESDRNISNIKIISLDGKIVKSVKDIPSQQIYIDLIDLPASFYTFIRYDGKMMIRTGKLVKYP